MRKLFIIMLCFGLVFSINGCSEKEVAKVEEKMEKVEDSEAYYKEGFEYFKELYDNFINSNATIDIDKTFMEKYKEYKLSENQEKFYKLLETYTENYLTIMELELSGKGEKIKEYNDETLEITEEIIDFLNEKVFEK